MRPPLTKMISEYVAKVRFEDIPKHVIKTIKDSTIDVIGCGLLGSITPHARLIIDYVVSWGSREESVIWGTDKKAAAPFAAFANSMSAHAWDFDDTMYPALLHPAIVSVPAALSVAEKRGSVNGREFLTAIALGYEISNLVGHALNPRKFMVRGFYNSIPAIFSPVTIAGKLMGFEAEKFARAYGIAATQAAGLYSGTVTKRINAPKAVMGGIFAAELADRGLEAPTDVLEAEYSGFIKTFSDEPLWEVIPRDLGKFAFEVFLKYYPCIRSNHPAVEGIKVMMSEHPDIKHENIEKIVVHADTATVKYTVETTGGGHIVETVGNALISLPYCVAAMVVDGELTTDQFTEEKIKDPRIQALLKKVDVVVDPEIDKLPITQRYRCTIEVKLKDGRTYTKFYASPKGDPTNPLTKDELFNKFRRNASKVFKEDRIKELIKALDNLENLDDVSEIAKLLSTKY